MKFKTFSTLLFVWFCFHALNVPNGTKKKPEHVEMREKVENVLSMCLLVYFLMVVKFPVRLSCKNTHFFLPQFLRDMTHRQPIPHKISTDVKKSSFIIENRENSFAYFFGHELRVHLIMLGGEVRVHLARGPLIRTNLINVN